MGSTTKKLRLRIDLALVEPVAEDGPARRPRAPLAPPTVSPPARSRPVLSAPGTRTSARLVGSGGPGR